MSLPNDFVRDSELATEILSEELCVHTIHESDHLSGSRGAPRLEYWQRHKIIGRGSYGSVRLEKCVKGRRDSQVRAVKQITIAGLPQAKSLDYSRELEAIAKFSQPKYERCFVKSFGWFKSTEALCIAMEYFEHGDLQHYLRERDPLPENEAGEITFQILEGLKFMHENHFAHRDLKPANILIKSTPPEVWVKLGDFGLSKRVEDGLGISATLKGTMGFIAPELYGLTPRTTDYATDIWGLGEIAFQMLTKKPAFRDLSLLYRYAQELAPFSAIALHEQNVSTAAVDFILQAMTAQAASRLTASDALGHAWMLTFAPELPNLEELVLERKVSIESNNVSEPSAVWTSISEPPRQHLPKLEPEPCSHLVEDVGPLMSTSSGTAPPVPKYPARPEHIETTLETYHTDIPKPIERRDPDTPPTIACPHCADYAGECCEVHELQRHAKRAHAMVRTVWICFDASPDKSFLARCRRCRLKKRYDAYHHAAVHLRQAHFNPQSKGDIARIEKLGIPAYKNGGNRPTMVTVDKFGIPCHVIDRNWPPMDVLKENWMKQIEESARSLPFSRATTTRTSAEHSVGELNTMDEENMERQD